MLKKDDEIEVTIEDMGNEGEGVARYDGLTLFIKDTAIGDRIIAKILKLHPTYGYARLMKIIEPSADRVKPRCPVARKCGGCTLQHLKYKKQLEFKERKVISCLTRIGKVENAKDLMEPIIAMDSPWNYRNKAQFPVGLDKEGNVVVGFYAKRTHSIIDSPECLIQDKTNVHIISAFRKLVQDNLTDFMPYDETTCSGVIRHVMIRRGWVTGEIGICIVINKEDLSDEQKSKIVDTLTKVTFEDRRSHVASITLNVNMKNTNVVMGDKLISIYGPEYICDYIGDIKYEISPKSFYQVNPLQTAKLYGKALEYAQLSGSENVWDLYCGIGTISLFLAKSSANVVGVEIVPEAVENAKRNAVINDINNASFYVGKAEDVVPQMYEKSGGSLAADVVVVDPPRKGCDARLLDTIVKMAPSKLVYVSCDPATLARDVKWLEENGYKLEKFGCVDMFGMSGHVETVVLLSQRKADDYVEVELELDELDVTSAESKATYVEIKDYVFKTHGLKVSNLYISQVKRKCGIEVGENYNLPKSEDSRQPQCPEEKEKAIRDALEHFGMA